MNITEILIKAVELVPEVKAHLSEKALEFLKSIEQYDRQLWEYTLALYRGGDSGEFIDKFTRAISNQLTRAFNEGARAVGVEPEDMTDEDRAYLKEIIDSEYEHILDLGSAIEDSMELELSEFRQAFRSRIDLWIARYTDVINRAKTYFGGKTRLEWVLGETEQHCDTCAALNGIVAYAKEWEQAQVHPQSPPNEVLQCGGWKCDCSLIVTDKRRTSGALGRIMDIAVAANIGKSYNPNQPRVPAGDSEGGQWTSENSIRVKYRNGSKIVEKELGFDINPTAYHGTFSDSADSISKNGFIVSKDGTAGRGVYLTYEKGDAIYERDPNRSESSRQHSGEQPDTIIKTEINGKILNVGKMESKDGPSIYLKPNIYAAYVLSQTNGQNTELSELINNPESAIEIITSSSFDGLSWQFSNGRNATIVFDPSKIKVLSIEKS